MTKCGPMIGGVDRPVFENAEVYRTVCALTKMFPEHLGSSEVRNSALNSLEKNGKQFCVGLLENPVDHTWWRFVSSMTARQRLSVAGSLFLARKVLPSPPDPNQARLHAEKMSASLPPADRRFLSFCEKEVEKLFRWGWDKDYLRYCEGYIPTDSSCLERSRAKGGAKAAIRKLLGHQGFMDAVLTGTNVPTTFDVKFQTVPTSGKVRGVTIASCYSHILGPLHQMIYDRLTRTEWLLRGEAKPCRFSSFQEKKGEIFVSGDYESATDNLNQSVSELILRTILSKCLYVPKEVRDYAILSLRATIRYPSLGDLTVEQRRGQLMGNLLSFPLLCLTNYLAFRFSIPRRDVPVKINGDDIVFRCRPSEYQRWADRVAASGLVLSKGKTMTSRRCFSLNSSFFYSSNSRVRGIPVIRSSMLAPSEFNEPPTAESFSRFVRGWSGEASRHIGGLFLTAHRKTICATGRSVEALGIRANNAMIYTAGLHGREAFLRPALKHGRVSVGEKPMPPCSMKGGKRGIPPGWSQLPAKYVPGRVAQGFLEEFREESYGWSWSNDFKVDRNDWWAEVRAGSREACWVGYKKAVRNMSGILTGCGMAAGSAFLPLRSPIYCRRQRRVWVPTVLLSRYRTSFPGVGH